MALSKINDLLAWECRYFSNSLPKDFTHATLDSQFHRSSDESNEHDIYCFGKDSDANIKIRLRTNTLKLKIRKVTDNDGFELWETVFKHPLPAPPDKWEIIALSLGVETLQLSTLQELTYASAVIREITKHHPEIETVEVYKTRRFYRRGLAQLEVAKGHYNNLEFYSVQYESENLVDAQMLRKSFPPHDMGTPCSYTEFLHKSP